ncbi:hypothetical protein SAMN04515674_102127 [Pseudarcicella hirudinis]|uniref:Uncharacterized protein n=3 Tax=Pseudarcicella hirudinis TaxID=1079859 RepID=A0A1I5NUV3_9BACT|nr:hypothetical protein SAMN04515674_102127 [Pseudarcicella hirudinis]
MRAFYTLYFMIMLVGSVMAQTTASASISFNLPSVGLLDLEPNNSAITLAMQSPTEAGRALTVPSSNNTKWLNVTSSVAVGVTRKITAQISSGTLPAGLNLLLTVSAYSGSGSGTFGTAGSNLSLTTSAQNVVTGIGGAYTGNGANNGYNLTYSLQISNYGQLKHDASTSLTITYTLTDN